MKKILFLFLISSFVMNGQTESSQLCKSIDDFTDEESFRSGTPIAYMDGGDMKSEGMLAMGFVSQRTKGKEKGDLYISTFYLAVLGLSCVDEGSTLDIIFENGEKTQLINWNDFDCDGKNYFRLDGKEDLFKSSNITALRYTNKRNYERMTIKENIGEISTFLKDLLLDIDEINNGNMTIPMCTD
jgi:hypothetical protein